MKIGFASRWDPLDKRSWSGTCYYSYQQLKRFGEVEVFQYKMPKLLQEWLTTQKSINRRWFKKNTAVEFLDAYARSFSRQLSRELKKRPVDVLFVSASSQLIAYVETDIPIIYMTDATFQQLQGYYPNFSNLAAYNIKQGIALDKKAFQRTAHCLLASEWSKRSAVNDYGIDPAKISVAPCGANLDSIPIVLNEFTEGSGKCRLLFLGVEWERKGGDIALKCYHTLKEKGLHPTLHIIGCVPPHDLSADESITIIPFLDKNKEEDFAQLHHLLLQTDFLVLPTRAECAGVVFSEASAYGIPSVTTDTGGVSSYVKNGINGFTFPPEAGGELYGLKIAAVLADTQQHQQLKLQCRKLYEEQLNWDCWGQLFRQIATTLLRS